MPRRQSVPPPLGHEALVVRVAELWRSLRDAHEWFARAVAASDSTPPRPDAGHGGGRLFLRLSGHGEDLGRHVQQDEYLLE